MNATKIFLLIALAYSGTSSPSVKPKNEFSYVFTREYIHKITRPNIRKNALKSVDRINAKNAYICEVMQQLKAENSTLKHENENLRKTLL